MEYKNASLKEIPALTDRELQERICELLEKQEKHQYYFSTALTIYLVLTAGGIAWVLISALMKANGDL